MSAMPTTCARGDEFSSRSSRLFSTRELQRDGLVSPNTPSVNRIARFVERHATEPIADTAARLEMREARLYQEIEQKKTYALDTTLHRGKTCPVGERMRLLNKIAVALDLPAVYPGLRDLDASVS
jgi:hypothetical protein